MTGGSGWGPSARSALRFVGAGGALGESVAHIPVVEHHLYEAPYAGVLFVLVTVAGIMIAQLLLISDSPQVWVATAVVGALALLAYVVSRTSGLPQMDHDIGDWGNRLGTVAVTSELVMLTTAIIALALRAAAHSGRPTSAAPCQREPGPARGADVTVRAACPLSDL